MVEINSAKDLKDFLEGDFRKFRKSDYTFKFVYVDERLVHMPQSGRVSKFKVSKDKKTAQLLLSRGGFFNRILSANIILYLDDEGWEGQGIKKIIIKYEK